MDLVAFGAPLALYIRTLAPTVYNLDSAELTTAAATGGIAHPTGYPLYLSLGYLWTRLIPFGDVGFRMNLLSAVAGAGTVWLLSRICRRLDLSRTAIVGALGLLAIAPTFWFLSLVAEVYTLQTAIMAALILALMLWAEAPTSPWRWAAVGGLVGLGLSHHAATLLLAPGIAAFMLVKWRQGSAGVGTRQSSGALQAGSVESLIAGPLAGFAGLCAGLTPILYLPLRYMAQPALNYAGVYDRLGRFHPVDLTEPAGLAWLLTGQAFADRMFSLSPDWVAGAGQVLVHIVQGFFGVGVPFVLLGLAVLGRRRPGLNLMLGLFAAVNLAFYAGYRVVDVETMLLPLHLVSALWLAVGLDWLLDSLRAATEEPRGSAATEEPSVSPVSPATASVAQSSGPALAHRLSQGLVVAAVAFAMAWNWRLVDLSGDWSARTRGEAILAVAQHNALVLGWWDTVPVVEYLQLVEGRRPDVEAINRFLVPPATLDPLIRTQLVQRQILIDSVPPGLEGDVATRDVGPLLELTPVGVR